MPTIQFTSINGTQDAIHFDTSYPGWIGVNGSYLNPANSVHVPVISIIQNYLAIEKPTTQQTCDFALNMDAIDWRWFGSYTDGNEKLENTVHDFAVAYASLLAPPPSHDSKPHAIALTNYEYLNQDWQFNNGANLVGKTFLTIEPSLGLAQVTYGVNKFDQTWISVHLEQGDEISLEDAGAIWSHSFQSMANTTVVIDMPNGDKYDVKYGNTPNDQTWVLIDASVEHPLPSLRLDIPEAAPVI